MRKTKTRLLSLLMLLVMLFGMLPTAYADPVADLDVGADVDVVDNKGTSQAAVIDSAPAQFNVIVPTKLPFAILANNETLKATNAAIKNQGNGPVVLAGITAEGKGWAFADYDSVDFDKMPMNSKVFTMQLNGDKVPEAAVDTKVNVPITQSAWASGAEGSIYGKTDLPISYDGKFAPQADASEEAVVAHVVFTIGWQTADAEPSAPAFDASTFDFSVSDWPAAAADEFYTYFVADNKATITGLSKSGRTKESITEMPDSIDGVPVTTIGRGVFDNCTNLALTSLPDGVTSIERDAFRRCTNLALTSLPNGVTSIGEAAFFRCTSLALTSLPDGVTSIERGAFCGCTNLALTSLPTGLTSIGDSAFSACTNLALTSLPDGVTSIEDGAFYQCSNLALTSLPEGVTSIGECAFSACTNLTLTSLPDGVTSIGDNAFRDCTNLALTSLPDGLGYIRNNAFRDCTNLALTSLPDGLIWIGNSAFQGCTNLALTSLPDDFTRIGPSTFQGCTNLALTSLPDGLDYIGPNAFRDCTNLALTSLPNGVTYIGEGAFYGCTKVNIQTVPCSYGEDAFKRTKCETPVVK